MRCGVVCGGEGERREVARRRRACFVPFGNGNGVSRPAAAGVTPVWTDDWTPGSTDDVCSATAPTAKRPTMEATRRPCGRRTFLLEGVARLARLRRCHVRGDNLRARGQLFSALGAPGDIVTVPL